MQFSRRDTDLEKQLAKINIRVNTAEKAEVKAITDKKVMLIKIYCSIYYKKDLEKIISCNYKFYCKCYNKYFQILYREKLDLNFRLCLIYKKRVFLIDFTLIYSLSQIV